MEKITDMTSGIKRAINEGDLVYLAGFTHLIPFAAGHEIIRQGYDNLELIRATPDLIYDQMIAAGCASKVTFSWAGNPGVGSLQAFRRAYEDGVPNRIEIEEYTHFGMIARLHAGAVGLPFAPLRTFAGSDLPEHNEKIQRVESPYGESSVYVVPPLNPDVTIVHAHQSDINGNAQIWGIHGETKEAAFAADTVILTVEEIVDEAIIRADPNRTVITEDVVDYIIEEPFGAHPSYAQGLYDRDNDAYLEWGRLSKSHRAALDWLDEWVYGKANRTEYLEGLGTSSLLELTPTSNSPPCVNRRGQQ